MSPNAWGPIKQLAYVVADIDDAVRQWATLHGVGPWTVFRNTTLQGVCRGAETTVKLHVALSYQHELQIELIQPLSRTRSPYQDADGRPLTGMNHIAWHAHDLDSMTTAAQARGLTPVFAAGNGAVRVVYLEDPASPGPLFEFIEAVPAVLEGFAAGLQATRDWDGINPVVGVIDFAAL